jgi:hypothetical protein
LLLIRSFPCGLANRHFTAQICTLAAGVSATLHQVAVELPAFSFTGVAKLGAGSASNFVFGKSAIEQLEAVQACIGTCITQLDASSHRGLTPFGTFGATLLAQVETVEDDMMMGIYLLLIRVGHCSSCCS